MTDLPPHWTRQNLGEIAHTLKGKKPALGPHNETFTLPYITLETLEHNVPEHYTDGEKCELCNTEDILIVWDGSRCGFVGRGVRGAVGSTLAKLVCHGVDPSFLYYFLQSQYTYINRRAKGVGIPHVDPALFWKINVPLPPLSEQRRIASAIEELFTELNTGLKTLEKVKTHITRYRQAVLKYAFEGALTTREKNVGSSLGDKLEKDHWEYTNLGEIADMNAGFPSGKHNKERKGIPHLRPMNLTVTGRIDLSDLKYVQETDYDPLKKGDILFNNTNSPELLGKTACISEDTNWAYSNHMTRIRLKKGTPQFVAFYLHYLFLTGYFRMNCIHHVNQASIPVHLLERVVIPLPPPSEQLDIVRDVDQRLSTVNNVEKKVENVLKEAETLRHSILEKAFKGELARGVI